MSRYVCLPGAVPTGSLLIKTSICGLHKSAVGGDGEILFCGFVCKSSCLWPLISTVTEPGTLIFFQWGIPTCCPHITCNTVTCPSSQTLSSIIFMLLSLIVCFFDPLHIPLLGHVLQTCSLTCICLKRRTSVLKITDWRISTGVWALLRCGPEKS